MGYRSKVVIALSKEAYARTMLLGPLPAVFKEADANTKTDKGHYWRFEHIKWYDDYEEIQEVNALLRQLENEEVHDHHTEGYVPPYAFVRIGEDDADIETRGDPYEFDISVARSIEAPI